MVKPLLTYTGKKDKKNMGQGKMPNGIKVIPRETVFHFDIILLDQCCSNPPLFDVCARVSDSAPVSY